MRRHGVLFVLIRADPRHPRSFHYCLGRVKRRNLTRETPARYNITEIAWGRTPGGVWLHPRRSRSRKEPSGETIMRRWNDSRTFRSLNRLHLVVLMGLVCLRA